jgi:hypothetical protein
MFAIRRAVIASNGGGNGVLSLDNYPAAGSKGEGRVIRIVDFQAIDPQDRKRQASEGTRLRIFLSFLGITLRLREKLCGVKMKIEPADYYSKSRGETFRFYLSGQSRTQSPLQN